MSWFFSASVCPRTPGNISLMANVAVGTIPSIVSFISPKRSISTVSGLPIFARSFGTRSQCPTYTATWVGRNARICDVRFVMKLQCLQHEGPPFPTLTWHYPHDLSFPSLHAKHVRPEQRVMNQSAGNAPFFLEYMCNVTVEATHRLACHCVEWIWLNNLGLGGCAGT